MHSCRHGRTTRSHTTPTDRTLVDSLDAQLAHPPARPLAHSPTFSLGQSASSLTLSLVGSFAPLLTRAARGWSIDGVHLHDASGIHTRQRSLETGWSSHTGQQSIVQCHSITSHHITSHAMPCFDISSHHTTPHAKPNLILIPSHTPCSHDMPSHARPVPGHHSSFHFILPLASHSTQQRWPRLARPCSISAGWPLLLTGGHSSLCVDWYTC
jgi:hypothetical protein